MTRTRSYPIVSLTHAVAQAGALLTFLFAIALPNYVHSNDISSDPSVNRTSYVMPSFNGVSASALDPQQQLKLDQAVSYARHQAVGLLPSLPHMSQIMPDWLGGGSSLPDTNLTVDADEEESTLDSLSRQFSGLMRPALDSDPQALWVTPGYHHKGFLPLNDAMVMGVNMRHSLFSRDLQLDLHPFYGQNWHNSDAYWGTELGLQLGAGRDGNGGWGKISLRYDNGQSALMEHSRGADLHGEFRLSEDVSLHGGVREDQNSQLGNYVLLRWTLLGGN
jgi:hypothetical protein